jgi:hypothetical protein
MFQVQIYIYLSRYLHLPFLNMQIDFLYSLVHEHVIFKLTYAWLLRYEVVIYHFYYSVLGCPG